jgi:hypothetical protein
MGDARAELAGRITGFIVSQAVYVAAKLRVADALTEGPRSAHDLAAQTGADPDALYRVLRLLSAHGIFVEHEAGTFANSESSELLRDAPGSFRDFALVFGEEFYPAFGGLQRTVETGEPSFDAFFGQAWDDYLAAHPEKSARFNRFMAGGGKEAIVEALGPWRGDETVVDVGGGNGALLEALLGREPELRGVVFDLPHVAAEAEQRIGAAGLADRCRVVAGDYFEGVPEGADVYVLSRILHGWDDERARAILRAVRRAVANDGRLLIVNGVVAPPNDPGETLLDLVMLAVGGRERTESEWRPLLESGGFELARIRPGPPQSVLEALPI